jgi:hypothetical protein
MFLPYWPVLSLVVGLVLVAIFIVLGLAGKVCRARHEALPDRSVDSYLPEADRYVSEAEQDQNLASCEMPDMEMFPQGGRGGEDPAGRFEPGITFHLDQSMSPEGRREYGV